MVWNQVSKLLKLESVGGIVLFAFTFSALLLDNSPLSFLYQSILSLTFTIKLGSISFTKPILFWVNEGLMSLFFLLVGLELKREFKSGELSEARTALLPGIAALGGMVFPALIYIFFNYYDPIKLKGWAIPVATDIVFAVSLLSFLGKRVPLALKLFLLALATFDDLGAIVLIAFLHTKSLSLMSMVFAGLIMALLIVFNRMGVRNLFLYLLVGILLWLSVLKSGIHGTLAGVVLGFIIPHEDKSNSPLLTLENFIQPWVILFVLPLFAFVNAGLSFQSLSLANLFETVTIGIIAGLLIGKTIGVFVASFLAVKLGVAKLPAEIGWGTLAGVSLLCGVGFTMSLFLGTLAFQGNTLYLIDLRLGVLLGSFLSGVIGLLVLHFMLKRSRQRG